MALNTRERVILHCGLWPAIRFTRSPTEICHTSFVHCATGLERQEHNLITLEAALPCLPFMIGLKHRLMQPSRGIGIGEKCLGERICNGNEEKKLK